MRHKSQKYLIKSLFKLYLFLFFASSCSSYKINNNFRYPNNKKVEKSYYENGNIEYEAIFINGKLEGTSKLWLKDGTLISESNYNNGYPHGLWKKYFANGQLKYETTYEFGKKQGYEKWFYENGQIKLQQYYENGEKTNEIIRWKPDGSLIY